MELADFEYKKIKGGYRVKVNDRDWETQYAQILH